MTRTPDEVKASRLGARRVSPSSGISRLTRDPCEVVRRGAPEHHEDLITAPHADACSSSAGLCAFEAFGLGPTALTDSAYQFLVRNLDGESPRAGTTRASRTPGARCCTWGDTDQLEIDCAVRNQPQPQARWVYDQVTRL